MVPVFLETKRDVYTVFYRKEGKSCVQTLAKESQK